MAIYGQTLVALTVGLPVVSGLASLVLPGKTIRSVLVSVTALVLIGSSVSLLGISEFTYNPGHIYETAVLVLDFALLFYFLYVGMKSKSLPVIGLSLLQLVPVAYFEFVLHGVKVENILLVDRLSVFLVLIVNVVGSVVVVYALSYMEEHEHHLQLKESRQGRFFFFMLLLLGAMNGMVYSNSLYWLYFFWEITSLCCYELIRHDGTAEANTNAVTALWMALIGGVAFIGTMFVGYYTVGSIALTKIMTAQLTPILLVGFAFLALAAFSKSAQFPFHSWLLGAMVAPTPVSALLHSSTMVNAGIYLILRIAPALKGTYLSLVIAAVGAVTFTLTAILAIRQKVSKRVLAFSTIGNLGLIIMCAGINTSLSYTAAVILLFFHSISKGLLFMGAGVVENRINSRNIEDWEGLIGKLPFTTTVMLVGMATMFLPPFGMLLGKWVAVDAIISTPLAFALPIIILICIGSAATTFFWGKWLGYLTVTPMTAQKQVKETLPTPYRFAMMGLLAVSIVFSAGAPYIINNFVNPLIGEAYKLSVTSTLMEVNTGIGSFLVGPFWIATVAMVLLGVMITKKKGGVIVPAYLGGENVPEKPLMFFTTADGEAEASVSTVMLQSEIDEASLNKFAVIIGVLLIIVMFLVEVI
ncbi:MAG: proton-conducting transporter membrane subunit [Candidatus Bathyarchaeota archaeon]|nr:proton-conducting transporter membrane subunit [Candidatus Bathyarchaeota archaeon]